MEKTENLDGKCIIIHYVGMVNVTIKNVKSTMKKYKKDNTYFSNYSDVVEIFIPDSGRCGNEIVMLK